MTGKTRYFVIASLLVLTVGLGAGLVAYYGGLPTGAFSRPGGPDELQLVPHNASIVAYADVHEIMLSDVRQKVLPLLPSHGNGQQEFQDQTGINIETDIDHVVAALVPAAVNPSGPFGGVVLVRGRFDDVKIQTLMTDHGARLDSYKGRKILVAADDSPRKASFSLAFIEPRLVAVGSTSMVQNAIDLKDGGDRVTTNEELMNLVKSFDDGNAWAVGRFEALSHGKLPPALANQLPPIGWFAASGRFSDGISGQLRADANDEDAASSLRDVIRGLVALAKLQAGARPELRDLVDSLNFGGNGKTVTLSFNVSSKVLGSLAAAIPRRPASPPAR
jgi:hypothetical protein